MTKNVTAWMWLLKMTPVQAFKELREETERVKWFTLADKRTNVSMATQTMKNEGGCSYNLWGLMVGLELQFFRWAGRDFLLGIIFMRRMWRSRSQKLNSDSDVGIWINASEQLDSFCTDVSVTLGVKRTMFALSEMPWRFFNYACGF